MAEVCVFDVNETLLDLRALDPLFARALGAAAARQEWFEQLLQLAMVAVITNHYADFTALGAAALAMTAERRGRQLSDAQRQEILTTVRALPAQPDARAALEQLRGAGLRLAALTNGTAETAEAQFAHAGLRDCFQQVLSVDAVRTYKPAPEPYRMAAERLGVEIGEVRLIAAHAWDVAGALRAGCRAAFVARPGKVLDPLAPRPDIVGPDLGAVAEQIVERARLA